MKERNINKFTIDFTPEDELTAIKNLYIKLIVDKEHPEILERAEQLACEFMKQHEQT